MIQFLLDTNTVIYAQKRSPISVLNHIRTHHPLEIAISSITMAELEYGIANSSDPNRNRVALLIFLSEITILPFDSAAAQEYGDIRYRPKAEGTPICSNDLLIAAQARSRRLTLVTHNTKEFSRVDGLKLEDWVE